MTETGRYPTGIMWKKAERKKDIMHMISFYRSFYIFAMKNSSASVLSNRPLFIFSSIS